MQRDKSEMLPNLLRDVSQESIGERLEDITSSSLLVVEVSITAYTLPMLLYVAAESSPLASSAPSRKDFPFVPLARALLPFYLSSRITTAVLSIWLCVSSHYG